MNEELLMDAVRMLHEREVYFDKAWVRQAGAGLEIAAASMLGKSDAYYSARQILMAALAGDVDALRQYDYYGDETNPTK